MERACSAPRVPVAPLPPKGVDNGLYYKLDARESMRGFGSQPRHPPEEALLDLEVWHICYALISLAAGWVGGTGARLLRPTCTRTGTNITVPISLRCQSGKPEVPIWTDTPEVPIWKTKTTENASLRSGVGGRARACSAPCVDVAPSPGEAQLLRFLQLDPNLQRSASEQAPALHTGGVFLEVIWVTMTGIQLARFHRTPSRIPQFYGYAINGIQKASVARAPMPRHRPLHSNWGKKIRKL